MADPVSLASGLLTLVTFGIKSSSSLYRTVKDFNSHQRNVRELKEELEALGEVLESLNKAVIDTDIDFTALKHPLLRCGNACQDFETVIIKCTEHSDGPRTSFRDWARLKYMGDDITGFKNMLAGYKSTITIALCDVNLRTSVVTVNVLNEYKDMIKDTTSDLEESLLKVDSKLQTLLSQDTTVSNQDYAERQEIEKERYSIQQCLDICAQVSSHLDEVRPKVLENISTPPDSSYESATTNKIAASARLATANVLGDCKDRLVSTSSQLRTHLADIYRRLDTLSRQQPGVPDDRAAEQKKLQEEVDSIKQSLTICAQASDEVHQDRINVFEEVSMAEDGHQLLVSTFGDLIFARKITAGARSAQWLGQISDLSLQQLSRDRGRSVVEHGTQQQTEVGTNAQFKDQYGQGCNHNS